MTPFEMAALIELHNIAGILLVKTKKEIYGQGSAADDEFERRITTHNQLSGLIAAAQAELKKEYGV